MKIRDKNDIKLMLMLLPLFLLLFWLIISIVNGTPFFLKKIEQKTNGSINTIIRKEINNYKQSQTDK